MSFSIKPKGDGDEQNPGSSTPPQQPVYVSAPAPSNTLVHVGLGVLLAIVGVLGYSSYSTKTALEQRISNLEDQLRSELKQQIKDVRTDANKIAGEVDVVSKKVGMTAQEVEQARKYAERLRTEQEKADQRLASEIATKASTTDVAAVRQEATTKVEAVQQEAASKIGSVSGEVKAVAQDLNVTKQDLAASRRDLVDVRNTLSAQIARNSSELSDLRKKGERDYFEFDIRKGKKGIGQRVADIQLEVRDTDVKKQKYGVVIMVDDNRLEKKDRTANEPVQFLVGRDKLRYEVVVNTVDKDRIRGYVSAPKDKALAAERPTFRQP